MIWPRRERTIVHAFERSRETQERFADAGSALAPVRGAHAFNVQEEGTTAVNQP